MLWFVPVSTTNWAEWCSPLSPPVTCQGTAGGCHSLTTQPLETKSLAQEQAPAGEEICSFSQSWLKFSISQEGSSTNRADKVHAWFRFQQKILCVPYLHLNKAFNHVDLGAVLTCLNYLPSSQLIKLQITLGAEEQSWSQEFVVQKVEWPTYADRDKTEGILLDVRNIDPHNAQFPSRLLFHQHRYRRTILRSAPIDNHSCNPTGKVGDTAEKWSRGWRRGSSELGAVQQCGDLFPACAHLLRQNGKRSPKLTIHIHYQAKK